MSVTGTVYVIDDDASVQRALQRLFRTTPYGVVICDSAQAFLALTDISRPACLLVDVRMPQMTGLELQEVLAARPDPPPTIFVTGHGDEAMAQRASEAGAVAFLSKPMRLDALLEAVESALVADGAARDA